MSKPAWHFKKKRPSDTARDPISSEFFADESVEDAARSVIRESIQNSLDARDRTSSAPVEIRVHLGTGRQAAPTQRAGHLFNEIWEHLSAPASGLRQPPRKGESCAYLTIEDFGTSGLEGDPVEWTPKDNSPNAFYAFFRAEAYSEKSGDDRGRWGVGKLVFPRSSRASAFFGYTVQRSTRKPLLLGRMILRHHRVEHVEYLPDAFFGSRETVHGDPDFIVPISDPDYVGVFAETFGITRRTEPGLSVVIPWLDIDDDDEFTVDNLTRAIAREYLLPILRGELVATVSGDGGTARLDREELLKEEQRWTDDSLSVLLRVGRHASSLDPESVDVTRSAVQAGAPKWPEEALSKEESEIAREILVSGEPAAFDVPVSVYEKGAPPRPSRLRVHLLATGSAAGVAPVFVREGITITNARGPRIPGYLALVTIDDGPLATLLGDAENPAHTEWRPATRGFKEKYRFGKSFLDFVKSAPINVFKSIFEGEREDDIYSLASFFPDITSLGDRRGGGATRKPPGKGGGVAPPPPLPRRPRRYSVARISGGFEIKPGDPEATRPERIRIQAAYDVRRGSPLKRWMKFDFDLGNKDMYVDALGARVTHASGNEVLVDIDEDDFVVTVRGFDPNRDVFTRVTLEDGDGDQEV